MARDLSSLLVPTISDSFVEPAPEPTLDEQDAAARAAKTRKSPSAEAVERGEELVAERQRWSERELARQTEQLDFYERAVAVLHRPAGRPSCPHTKANGDPTCSAPMVPVGDGVYECANDHRGRRVKPRDGVRFPDIPRYKPAGGA